MNTFEGGSQILDHRRWKGASALELGTAEDDKLIQIHPYKAESGQSFNVLEVDARKEGDTTPLGHHAPDSLGRMADLAICINNINRPE